MTRIYAQPPALAARSREAIQLEAMSARVEAVADLQSLAELVARAPALPDMLSALVLVQQQVHGVRRACVAEARAVGYADHEIAAVLRIGVSDFRSRFPDEGESTP
ncbi:hypothetical protein [Leucobacter luti]|uniref:Uncharacterized protein n=1 Tax=Leucobacter luti TaxID=340320 RepID=A0A4Q7TYW0_9MICO|nr:hypothetical protein [Leucobacter luti]MBL3698989.1 hypothetical protein [Leucobacter luti]RZT66366.1 hypothetical protein EV139_1803 [Leucobacter luti]